MKYRIIVEDWTTLQKHGVYQIQTNEQMEIIDFQIIFQDLEVEIPEAQNLAEFILALQSEGEVYAVQY